MSLRNGFGGLRVATIVAAAALISSCATSGNQSSAPIPSPIPPKVQPPRESVSGIETPHPQIDFSTQTSQTQTVTLAPEKVAVWDIVVPSNGTFTLDFKVKPDGSRLVMLLLTVPRAPAGTQAPKGKALMSLKVSGTASQSIVLDAGRYYLHFRNSTKEKEGTAPVILTYRATFHKT